MHSFNKAGPETWWINFPNVLQQREAKVNRLIARVTKLGLKHQPFILLLPTDQVGSLNSLFYEPPLNITRVK